ncbi:hypothetical protein C8J57DRAFT_1710668 [Mycena rebaudengoi]|nr:hypothetical protein C8J57DRAFT_1710668 [Mycena rebaudengoi]
MSATWLPSVFLSSRHHPRPPPHPSHVAVAHSSAIVPQDRCPQRLRPAFEELGQVNPGIRAQHSSDSSLHYHILSFMSFGLDAGKKSAAGLPFWPQHRAGEFWAREDARRGAKKMVDVDDRTSCAPGSRRASRAPMTTLQALINLK